jgi:hypothetical protein
MKIKIQFKQENGELVLSVNGERWDTCFDVCKLLCEAELSVTIKAERGSDGRLTGLK